MNFTVKHLVSPRYPSPLNLSIHIGDQVANYTPDAAQVALELNGKRQSFEQAGPRAEIAFQGHEVHAGIVTCGGLCPGLNNVIRSVVHCLWNRYGVHKITGFYYGYSGLSATPYKEPTPLTPKTVEQIHYQGGSFLGSSRGPQPLDEMVETLKEFGITQLYCIGGDGTMKGAKALADALETQGITLGVIGIPKTIDNDLPFVDQTFGFDTAVSVASQAIEAAKTEAKSAPRGVGLVKLMGRHAGFIAATASLACRDVDLVLIPELPCHWDAILDYLHDIIQKKGNAVVVVAEGVGHEDHQPLMRSSMSTSNPSKQVDASGNPIFQDIGLFTKEFLIQEFKKLNQPIQLKYIDPSYLIRATPTRSFDSIYCAQLAENAVHAAMAGKTEVLIGSFANQAIHIPFDALLNQQKRVDLDGPLWRSVLDATRQPTRLT